MDAQEAKVFLRERLRVGCTIRVRPEKPSETHRGDEVRIHACDPAAERRLREALKALGLSPGVAYAKGGGWVIPCYGADGLQTLLPLLGGPRAAFALSRIESRPVRQK